MPASALTASLSAALAGSNVSFDTSGAAPPLITARHIECNEGPGPIGPICREVVTSTQSYIQFSEPLKAAYTAQTGDPLRDQPFTLSTICNSVFCADINRIRGDLGDVELSFRQTSRGAAVTFALPLTSSNPTLKIDSAPDVQLSDLHLSLAGTLYPSSERSGVALSRAIAATLDFESEVNNFPDGLLGLFYDVDAKIRAVVRDQVSAAFRSSALRTLLSRALTQAVVAHARSRDPEFRGFGRVELVRVTDGDLVIEYVPL